MKILQVVGSMNCGGVETWLMHVLRGIDRTKMQVDFLVHSDEAQTYREEATLLGARFFNCGNPNRFVQYARDFRRVLREYGPYDVVHSHLHHFNGVALFLAYIFGVPVRINHVHSDLARKESTVSPMRKAYLWFCKHCARHYATGGLACSRQAAPYMFGAKWEHDTRCQVLYCGIDLSPFSHRIERAEVRDSLEVPRDAFVIGHVGRFEQAKNHRFLVEVFVQVLRKKPGAILLLIGDGPLRPEVEHKVGVLGLRGSVRFLGVRLDVPRLMGAMDTLAFPSLYEGLGLVILESQAAGLPAVVAANVPPEADVVPELIQRLDVKEGSQRWADALLSVSNSSSILRQRGFAAIEQSHFNIMCSVEQLTEFYLDAVARHARLVPQRPRSLEA